MILLWPGRQAVEVVRGVRVVVEVELLLCRRQVVRWGKIRWLEVGRRRCQARRGWARERGRPGTQGTRSCVRRAQARDGAQGGRSPGRAGPL